MGYGVRVSCITFLGLLQNEGEAEMVIPDSLNVKNIIESFRTQKLRKPAERATRPTSTGKNKVYKDEVVFSSGAAELERIKGSLGDLEGELHVSEGRLASLQTQINSGTYSIKGEKVADKIVTESLLNELL